MHSMSDTQWSLIFKGWNSRKQSIYIVKSVLISSLILSSMLSILGFIGNYDFCWIALPYSIFFTGLLILFYLKPHQIILLLYLGSILIGFPIWMHLKQDPSVMSYITLLLIVSAAVIAKFRFTSAMFAFSLANLIIVMFFDIFNLYQNPDLSYSLAFSALLQVPLLTLGYLVAFYVNKVLMNSLKTQKTQLQLLKTTQQQLINQEKTKSLRILAGGIAHDYNNLLTVILGNINLLRMDLSSYPESLELVEEVENAAIQARDLTKELLTFSKETIQLKENVKLPPLLKKSIKFASSGSKTKIVLDVDEKLWNIQGNPTQLAQVIQNLVLNARQSMRNIINGGIIRVIAKNIEKEHGKFVSIKVIDMGQGIREEELEKIFNPYYTTKIGSHGLGLAICNTIIHNHRGNISVDSIPEKETIFEITIPAYFEQEKEIKNEIADVLVLEEDVDIIRTLKKNLQKIGYSLDFASTCHEVKRLFEESVQNNMPYKIIILDTSIPEDKVLCKTTHILKNLSQNVKIILSSDITSQIERENLKQHGFDAFLPKPYQIKDIRNLFDSLAVVM